MHVCQLTFQRILPMLLLYCNHNRNNYSNKNTQSGSLTKKGEAFLPPTSSFDVFPPDSSFEMYFKTWQSCTLRKEKQCLSISRRVRFETIVRDYQNKQNKVSLCFHFFLYNRRYSLQAGESITFLPPAFFSQSIKGLSQKKTQQNENYYFHKCSRNRINIYSNLLPARYAKSLLYAVANHTITAHILGSCSFALMSFTALAHHSSSCQRI